MKNYLLYSDCHFMYSDTKSVRKPFILSRYITPFVTVKRLRHSCQSSQEWCNFSQSRPRCRKNGRIQQPTNSRRKMTTIEIRHLSMRGKKCKTQSPSRNGILSSSANSLLISDVPEMFRTLLLRTMFTHAWSLP